MANENVFTTAKQLLVLKPKTVAKQAFHYKGFADAKNLIAFVGSKPKFDINASGEPVLMYRKREIKDNSIILRDSFGNVTDVLVYEQASELYEISAQSEWKNEAANKVVEKKVSKKK